MVDYNIIPAVDENYNFPPQIQRNIASYPEFLEVRERLGDSETQLITYSKELIQSRELIASVDSDLTRIKEVTIPQAVKSLEAVDQQAAIELEALNGQLVSAEGEISSAKGRVEVLEGQIVDEQLARDQLAQTTQQTFQDLDARLDTFNEDVQGVQTSVNGKNSITRSTEDASGTGVVAGDAWYKVDSNGDTMAMWIWSGSTWVASKVRNEMLDTVDVNKLKVHDTATMNTAVIDKLWVDGIAAKSIETSRLVVATGNIIPDGTELLSDTQWGDMRRDTVDKPMSLPAARWADYPFSGIKSIGNTPFTVSPGVEYVVETWIKADKPNSRFYMELRSTKDGTHGGTCKLETPTVKSIGSYLLFNAEAVPTEWTLYRGTWTPNNGVTEVRFGTFYFNHAGGTEKTASIGLAGFSMRPKVGAVLIEDGAVSADKISASKELSAKVGQFIEVETSSLVATKDITTPQAVINKLWADGISSKSLTTSYLAVASSNLLANGNAESDAFWDTEALPRVEITDLPGFSHAFHASEETYKVENPYRGPYSENQDSALFPVVPGETYLFEMWVKASVEGSRFMAWFLDADSNMASAGNKIVSPVKQSLGSTLMYIYSVPTQWTKYQAEITIKPGITLAQMGNFVFNYLSSSTGVYADVWVTGLSLKPMVGSTLIAPGSITTDKITVTEELSTNIANAMTVNTKELIVSEGATLNNAKVIGNLWAENFAAGKITTEMFSTSAAFSGPGVTINRTGINIGDKIYMNASSGFYALNSAGRRTFEISPTGTAKFSGEVTSSAEITGSYIRTGTSGARLEMVGTTLKAFNSSNLETFRVNSEGSTYWYGDRKIGRIGESYKKGNTSVRGLVNHLETTGDYISWAYLENSTDTEFTSMMTLDPKGRFYGHSGGGLYIETGVKAHNTGWNPNWSGFEVSVVTIAGNNLPAIKWGSTYLAFSSSAMYAVTNGTYYRIDKA